MTVWQYVDRSRRQGPGLIAPDEATFEYLASPAAHTKRGAAWERGPWRPGRALPSDPGRAAFDRENPPSMADSIEPMISYGTHPGMVMPIGARIPRRSDDPVFDKALAYMGFTAGCADPRPARQRGVHRELHEWPAL